MTRRAEVTVRRPGTRIAPVISTRTCRHVGAVKPARKGSIHAASTPGRSRPVVSGIHSSPNRCFGNSLDDVEAGANPPRHHVRFRSRRTQLRLDSADTESRGTLALTQTFSGKWPKSSLARLWPFMRHNRRGPAGL